MPELSDLLRQRLALGESANGHPDADTLTAYTEKLLSSPEWKRVLEHVALCSQCREVIALSVEAASPTPEVAVIQLPSKGKRRIWAPVFGLAASAAAMAVIAVLIVKQPSASAPTLSQDPKPEVAVPAATPAMVSSQAPVSSIPVPEAPARSGPIGEAASRVRQAERRPIQGTLLADRSMSPAPPVIVSANQSNVRAIAESVETKPRHDYLNSNLFKAQDTFSPSQDAPVEIANSSGPRGASPQVGNGFLGNNQLSVADLPQGTSGSKVITTWRPNPGSAGHRLPILVGDIKHRVVELMGKRPPAALYALSTNTMSGPEFNPARDKTQSTEVASLKENSGKDSDSLGGSQAFTSRALSGGARGTVDTRPQTAWAVGDGRLLRTNETGAWVAGYTGSESIEFSAVTFHGSDVWAGGHRAAVVHSRDGGVTWERVHLGDSAAGNVSAISAVGPNLQVITSENQTWSSQDGGKTWTQN